MASAEKTYVVFILDKSGSMNSVRQQTIDGFNEHVQQIKINSKETEILASLVTFNGNVEECFWNQPADTLAEITSSDYRPEGGTALNDAIGYSLRKLSETTDLNDENNSYLVFIMSDGEENSSHNITAGEVKELIESYQKNERWTFTYMGCDAAYLERVSQNYGIQKSNMAVYTPSSAGTVRSMKRSSEKFDGYLKARATGVKCMAQNFYSDNSLELADFTADETTMTSNPVVDNRVVNTGPAHTVDKPNVT